MEIIVDDRFGNRHARDIDRVAAWLRSYIAILYRRVAARNSSMANFNWQIALKSRPESMPGRYNDPG
jgi:hypothetical protein